jgi:hypothetical protein
MKAERKYPLILRRIARCEVCGGQLSANREAKLCKKCLGASLSSQPNQTISVTRTQGHYWSVKALQKSV